MASIYWLGTASPSVQQVDTFTPASVTTGDVNNLTYTAEDGTQTVATFTIGGTQTAAAASAGLIAAWNGNTTLAAVATATGTSTVILTAVTAGVPFAVAASVTGTGTLSRAATVANKGANDWGTASNWSGGSVPVSSDNVTLDGRGAAAVLYGLNQSAVTLANLNIDKGFTFAIGTATAPLKISATNWRIGQAPGDGSSPTGTSLINLNFGTVQYTGRMLDSNTTGTSGLPTVNVKGSHASNKIYMSGGTLGIGTALPGDTATVSAVSVTGGKLTVGPGVTWTTIDNNGGTLIVAAGAISGTLTTYAGSVTTEGTALIGTLSGYGGTVKPNHRVSGSASVTNFNVYGATFDFTANDSAITMTNTNLRTGALRTAGPSQLTLGTVAVDFNNKTQVSLSA